MLNFNILTIFPTMFPGVLDYSVTGSALHKGLWSINVVDIREFAQDAHKTVDDRPYGGGPGMVMKASVLGDAIDYVLAENPDTHLVYMSPSGVKLNQDISGQLAKLSNITILCGRFEGIDRRVIEFYRFNEVSIGDYIISGGELAAMVLIDACVRLVPGVVGNANSIVDESFGNNYGLEYPHYTRPSLWRGMSVPELLLSGNHEKIKKWRNGQSYALTKDRRPDLVDNNKKEEKE